MGISQDRVSTARRGADSRVGVSGTTTPGMSTTSCTAAPAVSATSGVIFSSKPCPGTGFNSASWRSACVVLKSLVSGQGSTASRGAEEEEKEEMDQAECVESVELRDDTAGRPYLWNRRSRATVWDPLEGGSRIVWMDTRAVTWSLPALDSGWRLGGFGGGLLAPCLWQSLVRLSSRRPSISGTGYLWEMTPEDVSVIP